MAGLRGKATAMAVPSVILPAVLGGQGQVEEGVAVGLGHPEAVEAQRLGRGGVGRHLRQLGLQEGYVELHVASSGRAGSFADRRQEPHAKIAKAQRRVLIGAPGDLGDLGVREVLNIWPIRGILPPVKPPG
jgi:hypothetical protein